MEAKPLVIIQSNKGLTTKQALKSMKKFVDLHNSKIEELITHSLVNSEKLALVPDDILEKLSILTNALKEEIDVYPNGLESYNNNDINNNDNNDSDNNDIVKVEQEVIGKKRKFDKDDYDDNNDENNNKLKKEKKEKKEKKNKKDKN
jgi:hypothetical protein